MIANEFVALCNEYGVDPSLVAEDMMAAGLRSITVEQARKFIEDNY
jgi:hypothetical protein